MVPYQIRLPEDLLEKIRISAEKFSEGNVNREVRDLIRIALDARASEKQSLTCDKCGAASPKVYDLYDEHWNEIQWLYRCDDCLSQEQ